MPRDYQPTYAEETFIVHLFGTDKEIELYENLMEFHDDPDVNIRLLELIEEIKHRNFPLRRTHCCSKCPEYKDCPLKYIRSEKGAEQICCNHCSEYSPCKKIIDPVK